MIHYDNKVTSLEGHQTMVFIVNYGVNDVHFYLWIYLPHNVVYTHLYLSVFI